jgi:hypothetical protein
VRLFFDEDRGKGVAIALDAVGVSASYVGPTKAVKKGTLDDVWIPRAGNQGWLVITANKAILTTEHERELWIEYKVGGVFLTTNQIRSIDELRLMLRKLSWLESIDREVLRPFAFMLNPSGKTRRAPEIPVIGPGGQPQFW